MLAISQDVLDLAEAASYLRVSEDVLKEQAREGRIPARKIGKEWRFFKPALDAWLSTGSSNGKKDVASLSTLKKSELIVLIEELHGLLHQPTVSGKEPKKYSKERLRALIGNWKDDPYAEELLREIDRERSTRPQTHLIPSTSDGST